MESHLFHLFAKERVNRCSSELLHACLADRYNFALQPMRTHMQFSSKGSLCLFEREQDTRKLLVPEWFRGHREFMSFALVSKEFCREKSCHHYCQLTVPLLCGCHRCQSVPSSLWMCHTLPTGPRHCSLRAVPRMMRETLLACGTQSPVWDKPNFSRDKKKWNLEKRLVHL